jgi:hypothetical protein
MNKTDKSLDYTHLTVFSLETTYIVFLSLIFVHYLCLVLIKYSTALGFKGRGTLTAKVYHILTQLIFPVNYMDWDDADGAIETTW